MKGAIFDKNNISVLHRNRLLELSFAFNRINGEQLFMKKDEISDMCTYNFEEFFGHVNQRYSYTWDDLFDWNRGQINRLFVNICRLGNKKWVKKMLRFKNVEIRHMHYICFGVSDDISIIKVLAKNIKNPKVNGMRVLEFTIERREKTAVQVLLTQPWAKRFDGVNLICWAIDFEMYDLIDDIVTNTKISDNQMLIALMRSEQLGGRLITLLKSKSFDRNAVRGAFVLAAKRAWTCESVLHALLRHPQMDLRKLPNRAQKDVKWALDLYSKDLRLRVTRAYQYDSRYRHLFWYYPIQLQKQCFTWLCVIRRVFPRNQQFPRELIMMVVEFIVGAFYC